MPNSKKKTWIGEPPSVCDMCNLPITKEFIDAKTCYGVWGCLCFDCHETYGVGLGEGRGQKYVLNNESNLFENVDWNHGWGKG